MYIGGKEWGLMKTLWLSEERSQSLALDNNNRQNRIDDIFFLASGYTSNVECSNLYDFIS